MQRAQRAHDNPALDLAVELGNALASCRRFLRRRPLPNANLRHYAFMQQAFQIPPAALPPATSPSSCAAILTATLPASVTRPEPRCSSRREPHPRSAHWRDVLAKKLRIPYYTVDADVVVPASS